VSKSPLQWAPSSVNSCSVGWLISWVVSGCVRPSFHHDCPFAPTYEHTTDGVELMIIIVATFAQALSGNAAAVHIIGVLIVWRFIVRPTSRSRAPVIFH